MTFYGKIWYWSNNYVTITECVCTGPLDTTSTEQLNRKKNWLEMERTLANGLEETKDE